MSDSNTPDKSDLRHFTGSEHWYRHALVRDIVFTDGAKYVADRGGAYWLLDAIALANRYDKRVAKVEFQVWTLTVNPDRTGTLVCSDGNRNAVYTQALDFTDFPLPEISLYFQNKTIFLPSEY
jgi:hypothetical protein